MLAMGIVVLVVDTSFMNVSISAVVDDLHTTVSGVQSATAVEVLVTAAFILISSKVGDSIGLPNFRIGITQQMLQQITSGGTTIAPPLLVDDPRVQRLAGLVAAGIPVRAAARRRISFSIANRRFHDATAPPRPAPPS
jgi:hypothetical protein